jgi:hypothetical protein
MVVCSISRPRVAARQGGIYNIGSSEGGIVVVAVVPSSSLLLLCVGNAALLLLLSLLVLGSSDANANLRTMTGVDKLRSS